MARTKTLKGSVNSAEAEGKKAAKKAAYSPTMERLMRLGYATKGLIYITIGLLAILGTLGKSSTPADQLGAIAAFSKLPYGMFALWIVLIGLISYSLWGLIRAILDPFHKGNDTKGLLIRGGYLVSAVTYASFVFPTYELITGAGGGSQSHQTQKFVAMIMSTGWGRVGVGILGLAVVAGGLYQIYSGITSKFDKQFKLYALDPQQLKIAIQLGRFGTIARGVVFALIGLFLGVAALYANPSSAKGFDGALNFLARQPYGLWLLGIIALGLIAFGIYSIMSAAWFKLKNKQ